MRETGQPQSLHGHWATGWHILHSGSKCLWSADWRKGSQSGETKQGGKGVNIEMKNKWFRVKSQMQPWGPPFLCYCWQSESDGQPPVGLSCSCKSFLWDPSDAVNNNKQHNVTFKSRVLCFSITKSCTVFTSRMKNLAVLALPQVFFRRDTGLMFIPAMRRHGFKYYYLRQRASQWQLTTMWQFFWNSTKWKLTDDGH